MLDTSLLRSQCPRLQPPYGETRAATVFTSARKKASRGKVLGDAIARTVGPSLLSSASKYRQWSDRTSASRCPRGRTLQAEQTWPSFKAATRPSMAKNGARRAQRHRGRSTPPLKTEPLAREAEQTLATECELIWPGSAPRRLAKPGILAARSAPPACRSSTLTGQQSECPERPQRGTPLLSRCRVTPH